VTDLKALVDLVRLFRRERFAIVHAHMPKSGVLGRVAAWIAGVPVVINTIHGPYGIDADHPARRWFFLSLERLAARCSDFELCQSREVFDLFTRLRIFRPERSCHLGNGIDLGYFDPRVVSPAATAGLRTKLGLSERSLVVGTVGRLVWDKGYAEFIAAAERVRQQRSNVEFIAVGPREERDALAPEVISRAEDQGIRFLGLRTDMRELYSLMDIFVLASYREGFPRAAMEAAAMRAPLILTDIRGCREVVTQNRNGLLVPAREVQPLAQAILQLVDDQGLRRRFGEESRRRALEEFDEQRVFARVLATYRELVAKKAGSLSHGYGAESATQR
jgi:glycosyltransferase involved in cell wall biosynthesis